ncbi:MAG: ketol-acid reductoisomerase [Candidatus Aenigmarchaeota archaeon ex4484_52]|nr:MAG: ketol-acid reductoisomerase [Candidatus Aenigmarchaeota archaeon ex4484_52]
MKTKIYHDADVNSSVLKNKKIAVIGYGSQGKAQANCMKDSGLNVIVGVRKNGASFQKAQSDGLNVFEIDEAANQADIIHILIPDEIQKRIYDEHIKEYITEGKTLSFSHGFNISYKQIIPPKNVDVIMVAPKSPGTEERKRYLEGFGVPGLIAVENDFSGNAKNIALEMAKAMGFTRAGVFECSFNQETFSDLFGEQCVLCGGLTELIKAGFETLVKKGYPPQMAYFECMHEVKLIVDLLYEGGLQHMWKVVSNTAEYGGRTVGPKIITDETKKIMENALDRIESGEFAKEWLDEYRSGNNKFNELRKKEEHEEIEITGKEIRKLFEKKRLYKVC